MLVNKIVISIDQSSRAELKERAGRMVPNGPPFELNPLEQSIHFLRGVNSRASLCLPAFYFFVGASLQKEGTVKRDHPLAVSASYMEFSCLNTISLACRKAFDHSITGLTGAKFAKTSDEVLAQHAEYWAEASGKPAGEAALALTLLKEFFGKTSRHSNVLLRSTGSLQMRLGLLKQHADRIAAHLSLEPYEIDLLDVAHFVASFSLVGEIVRSFDATQFGENYFQEVDEVSAGEARRMFPDSEVPRLFGKVDPVSQARSCWRYGKERGLHMLLEQLPYAISWF